MWASTIGLYPASVESFYDAVKNPALDSFEVWSFEGFPLPGNKVLQPIISHDLGPLRKKGTVPRIRSSKANRPIKLGSFI